MAAIGSHPMASELREAEAEGWDLCEVTSSALGTIETEDTRPPSSRAPSRQELFSFHSIDGRACGLVPRDQATQPPTPGLEACLDAMRHAQRVTPDTSLLSDESIEVELQRHSQQNVTDPALPRSMRLALQSHYPWPSSPAHSPSRTEPAFDKLPYFVYGASMFPAMLARLELDKAAQNSGQQTSGEGELKFRLCPAVLPGFVLHALHGKPYPACVHLHRVGQQARHSHTDVLASGMLLHLPRAKGSLALRASLHALQNKDYELERVKVFAAGTQRNVSLEAFAYVLRGDPSQLVPREVRLWQVEDLLRNSWFQAVTSAEKVRLMEQRWMREVEAEVEWPE